MNPLQLPDMSGWAGPFFQLLVAGILMVFAYFLLRMVLSFHYRRS